MSTVDPCCFIKTYFYACCNIFLEVQEVFIYEAFLEISLEWTTNRLLICSLSVEELQNLLLHYSEYCFSKTNKVVNS